MFFYFFHNFTICYPADTTIKSKKIRRTEKVERKNGCSFLKYDSIFFVMFFSRERKNDCIINECNE